MSDPSDQFFDKMIVHGYEVDLIEKKIYHSSNTIRGDEMEVVSEKDFLLKLSQLYYIKGRLDERETPGINLDLIHIDPVGWKPK